MGKEKLIQAAPRSYRRPLLLPPPPPLNSHASGTGRSRLLMQSATVHCDYGFPQGPGLCLTTYLEKPSATPL